MLESFNPIASPRSRILILGTMPGKRSLEKGQYYAYKYNQFWRIMATLLGFCESLDYQNRCRKLIENDIALWDVLCQCRRQGSLDSNITSEKPNDIKAFLETHQYIQAVFFNGANAEKFFKKHIMPSLSSADKIVFERLPSTSPANASLNFEQKLHKWSKILEQLRTSAK